MAVLNLVLACSQSMYRLLSHTFRNMYCGHMHMYVTIDNFTVVSLAKDVVTLSGNLLLSKQVKVNIFFVCVVHL